MTTRPNDKRQVQTDCRKVSAISDPKGPNVIAKKKDVDPSRGLKNRLREPYCPILAWAFHVETAVASDPHNQAKSVHEKWHRHEYDVRSPLTVKKAFVGNTGECEISGAFHGCTCMDTSAIEGGVGRAGGVQFIAILYSAKRALN